MAISLVSKRIAITGASGTMGRALLRQLAQQGAELVALTTSTGAEFEPQIACECWQPGREADLKTLLATVDILIINHGINVHGQCHPEAIQNFSGCQCSVGLATDGSFFLAPVSLPPAKTLLGRFGSTPLRQKSARPLAPFTKRLNGSWAN